MRTPIPSSAGSNLTMFAVALFLLAPSFGLSAGESASAESLPRLVVGDRVWTNVVIVRATSAGLVIRHSTGGATVPYGNLPEALQERFGLSAPIQPVAVQQDPVVAADLARRQREFTEDARREFLRNQETRLSKRLSELRVERARLDQIIRVLHNVAKGKRPRSPERAELDRVRARKIAVINQMAALEAELDRIQERLLGMR